MRKILRMFKATILASTIATTLIACTNTHDEKSNYVDISNVTIETSDIAVVLNKENYNNALVSFKEKIQDKISALVTKGQKPKYGVDYKIAITNHKDIYAPVDKYEQLEINVLASTTTNILTGSFKGYVNLVAPRKDISSITIDQQVANITINTTTFSEALALHCLSLIQSQIILLAPTAQQDIDYVVNVEGHKLSERINKVEPVNVNITAIEDDYHLLLHGSFSFLLTFIEK